MTEQRSRAGTTCLGKWKPTGFHGFLSLLFLLTMLTGCGSSGGDGDASTSEFTGGTGTAVLSWAPPSTNTDGSPVSLTGFRVYIGTSPANLQYVRTVSALDTNTLIDGLPVGVYFFAVTAVSDTGAESALSNIETKTIS